MFGLNRDEIMDKLSRSLPLGLGRTHTRTLAVELDKKARSCLDIGCGRGVFNFMRSLNSVGCDIYRPGLLKAREKEYYKNLVNCDVRDLPFKPKSFDVTICFEVIEHLDKTEGIELLKRMEEITRRQIIITTPWGYFPLEERQDNPNLNHLSGWLPQEFKDMGYRTRPVYYPRYPMGSKLYETLARYLLTPLLYPFIRLFPQKLAMDFIAIKELV